MNEETKVVVDTELVEGVDDVVTEVIVNDGTSVAGKLALAAVAITAVAAAAVAIYKAIKKKKAAIDEGDVFDCDTVSEYANDVNPHEVEGQ